MQGIAIEDSKDVNFERKIKGDWDYFEETLLNIKEGAVIKHIIGKMKFLKILKYIEDSVENLRVNLDLIKERV